MRLTVIGTADDVTGFGLAGVPGVTCETEADVEAALEAAGRDDAVALVVVSAAVAALAPAAVRIRQASGVPLVMVLPALEAAGDRGGLR